MGDWYDQIEEPVRELVRSLRNNGFNTFSSCGHDNPCPHIEMEWYGLNDEPQRLYALLQENGYKDFELHFYWHSSRVLRFAEIKLCGVPNLA